jgi:hypothetical protein
VRLTAKEKRRLKQKNPRLLELPRRPGEPLGDWLARLILLCQLGRDTFPDGHELMPQ